MTTGQGAPDMSGDRPSVESAEISAAPPVHRRRRSAGAAIAAMSVSLVLLLVLCPLALGNTLTIQLHNETPYRLTLQTLEGGGRSFCWTDGNLHHGLEDGWVAGPGQTRNFTTYRHFNGGCDGETAYRYIGVVVQQPGYQWGFMDPNPSGGGYRITNQDGYFVYRDSLGTWLPMSRPGVGGQGFICWRTNMGPDKYSDYSNIYFFSDSRCNSAVGTEIGPGGKQYNPPGGAAPSDTGAGDGPPVSVRAAVPARAGSENSAAAGSSDAPQIVSLLSTVGIACPWYAYPGDSGRCNSYDPGDGAKWSLGNLTSTIRDFKVAAASSDATETKLPIGYDEHSVPANAGTGTVSVSQATAISTATTTSTTNGFMIGGSVAYGSKATANVLFARAEGSVTVSVSGSYNYSSTTSKTDSTTKTVTISNTQPALPGFTTALDVFTTKRDASYKYDADLDFGKDNADENVTTPANAALNQSPGRYQPCLAYTVGNGAVRNSIMNIGDELVRSGISPTDSSLPPERRGFLQSFKSFRTSGTCPGFPTGFASAAAFKGSGIGSYADAGYDEQGRPATKVTACVYTTPYPATARVQSAYNRYVSRAQARRLTDPRAGVAASASASACKLAPLQSGPVSGETPGTLIDDSAVPVIKDSSRPPTSAAHTLAPMIAGPNHSDEVIGNNQAGEKIYTGTGAFDLVRMGDGNHDGVFGGAGDNLIFGGSGSDDHLVGGAGTNEIHAGSGRHDVLSDANGHAVLVAGSGGDTLVAHNMTGAMVGGPGADTFVATGNASRLTMAGGGGDDTFILRAGRGTPNMSVLPGDVSTLRTGRSLTAPLYMRNVIATGSHRVTLRGALGTRKLVANNGTDRLVAGPGAERLLGGRGNDTFVLTDLNEDTATGGKGADRYVFTGTPEVFQRPWALQRPADRTADLITNFRPGRGDRLVLRTTVFGSQLLSLRRSFKVVANSDPQPHCHCASLLLDTSTGVLSFDRDGTGPISDQVIAKLPGLRTIRPGWVQITR
jgi:Ca2+-binding RTX toxin-like protein